MAVDPKLKARVDMHARMAIAMFDMRPDQYGKLEEPKPPQPRVSKKHPTPPTPPDPVAEEPQVGVARWALDRFSSLFCESFRRGGTIPFKEILKWDLKYNTQWTAAMGIETILGTMFQPALPMSEAASLGHALSQPVFEITQKIAMDLCTTPPGIDQAKLMDLCSSTEELSSEDQHLAWTSIRLTVRLSSSLSDLATVAKAIRALMTSQSDAMVMKLIGEIVRSDFTNRTQFTVVCLAAMGRYPVGA